MKEKKPGILEVAKAAGVSPATVSRVFNGNPKVDSELKAKVCEVAKRMGYKTNYYAKVLIQGKTNFVGLLLTKFEIRHYSGILQGIEIALNDAGYTFFVTNSRYEKKKEEEKIQLFIDLNFAGMIIVSVGLSDEEIIEISMKGTPVLVYDRLVHGLEDNCIYFDDSGMEEKLTNHLIENGHRKIAHICGPDRLPVYRERKKGFIAALTKNGIPVVENLIYICDAGGFSMKDGYHATKELLKRGKFTALVCQNDQTAIGAISAIREEGLDVPDDISIVGFNDVPEAAYVSPPLTTIRFEHKKVGHIVGEKIISLIEHREANIVLPEFEIIYRSSVKNLNK